MDKSLLDALAVLNLSTKDTKFFEVCFKFGPISINDAAKLAKIERSTAYLIVESLLEKGLLEEDFKQYKKRLIACEPKKILRMIASKQRSIQRKELELEEKLPVLQAEYHASVTRPSVRVFEGKSALYEIMNDILSESTELLLWSNQEAECTFFTPEFHNKFIAERIKRNIPIRVLAVWNTKGLELHLHDESSLRQTKILPKEVNFSAETYIYGDKIAVIDYKKDIIGVIIESEQITKAQKAIFELSWKLSSGKF